MAFFSPSFSVIATASFLKSSGSSYCPAWYTHRSRNFSTYFEQSPLAEMRQGSEARILSVNSAVVMPERAYPNTTKSSGRWPS